MTIANTIRDAPLWTLVSQYAHGIGEPDWAGRRAVILDACMEAGPREVHNVMQAAFGMTMPEDYRQHVLELAILYYLLAPKAPAGMNSLIYAMTYSDPREWPAPWRSKRPTQCPAPGIVVNFTRKRFHQYAKEGRTSAEFALLDAMRDVMVDTFTECLFHERYRIVGVWAPSGGSAFLVNVVRGADGHVVASHAYGEGMSYSQVTKQIIEQWKAEVQDIFTAEYLEREGDVALHEVLGWSPIYIRTMQMIETNAQAGHAFSG